MNAFPASPNPSEGGELRASLKNLELFDKIIYALTLANDYFTVPEQEMSFFGVSNSANSEQYLSITSNTTKVYHINTLDKLKNININTIW